MLIAHLSDPHITTGALAAEPASGLYRALGRVLAVQPQPDCVVLTGDLVDRGRPDEYAVLREVIGGFPLPMHLVAGNHDGREALLGAFGAGSYLDGAYLGGASPGDGQAHYTVEYPAATIVVLDSLDPETDTGRRGAGRLGADQLGWLDEALGGRRDVPAIVCLHHPPIPVGLPFMDSIRLVDGAAFGEVIARHPHVLRVLAGHLHRTVSAAFAGSTLAVAPSTYRQTGLRMLTAEEPPGYLHEPTGFLLHLLTGSDCITHSVPVSHAAELTISY